MIENPILEFFIKHEFIIEIFLAACFSCLGKTEENSGISFCPPSSSCPEHSATFRIVRKSYTISSS